MALFVLADSPSLIGNRDVYGFAYGHYIIAEITGTDTLMRATSTDGRFMVEYVGTGMAASGSVPTAGHYTEMRAFLDGQEIVRLSDFGGADFTQITTNALPLEESRNQLTHIIDGEGGHSLVGGMMGTIFENLERGDYTQGGTGDDTFHISAEASWTEATLPEADYDFDGSSGNNRIVFHGGDHPGGFADLRGSIFKEINTLEFHDGVTAILYGWFFVLGSQIEAEGLGIDGTARIVVTNFQTSSLTNHELYADPSRWVFHDPGPHYVEIRGIRNATVTGNAASFDRLIGGTGDATIIGAGGSDWLQGGDGNDLVVSGGVGDTLGGGAGDDTLVMDDAQDVILDDAMGTGDWLITHVSVDLPERGVEHMRFVKAAGDAPVDMVSPFDARSTLIGNTAENRLQGGRQWDRLQGWSGSDTLIGGGGADTLTGGAWGDRLVGGAGVDVFVLQDNSGRDRIIDFATSATAHDVIDLSSVSSITGFADLRANHLGDIGAAVRIDLGGGHHADLVGVTAAELTAAMFLFAASG